MKINCWAATFVLLSGLVFPATRAEETAVVTQNTVNVRGGPSLYSEVITHLKQGNQVTILEEIAPQKPKPGDPDKWARIKLPDDTHVWVFASYIKNDTVAVKKINLRGGPGENFSVLGLLQKGDRIKPLRTLQDWIEIEAPSNASAYVALEVLKKVDAAPVEPPKTAAPVVTPAPVVKTLPKDPPMPSASPKPETSPPLPSNVAPPVPREKTEETPVVTEPLASPVLPVAAPVLEPKTAVTPPPPEPVEEVPVKRVVRREGIVRGAVSIQAPTGFVLVNPEDGRTMDYLHGEKNGIPVKQFKGQQIIVTGEEGIDSRWPNTPVLEIETIASAP